jgi:hypothetical protein
LLPHQPAYQPRHIPERYRDVTLFSKPANPEEIADALFRATEAASTSGADEIRLRGC